MVTVPGTTLVTHVSRRNDIERINEALNLVASFLSHVKAETIEAARNTESLTTPVDTEIDRILHDVLPRGDEGWLSEESPDDLRRLDRKRVWIVDPVDGTREFILDVPEWCVSIGLVENGKAVAGGILNPSTGEKFLGSNQTGFEVIDREADNRVREVLEAKSLLVSRREYNEGKWSRFEGRRLPVKPVGSVAYRLAQVAARRAAATCTFLPRQEWDVAAGVALVAASGGRVQTMAGEALAFNRPVPRFENLVALSSCCDPSVFTLLSETEA